MGESASATAQSKMAGWTWAHWILAESPHRIPLGCGHLELATHELEDGDDIRTVQQLLDHSDVSTTMIDAHLFNRGGCGVQSPLDRL